MTTDITGCRIGAVTSRRGRWRNASEPGAKQLDRARRKLSTVTACSSAPTAGVGGGGGSGEDHDVEHSAAQLELGEW